MWQQAELNYSESKTNFWDPWSTEIKARLKQQQNHRCFLKIFLTSLLCCPFNSCTSELAFRNPYAVPDVAFKPDVGAARGFQKQCHSLERAALTAQ